MNLTMMSLKMNHIKQLKIEEQENLKNSKYTNKTAAGMLRLAEFQIKSNTGIDQVLIETSRKIESLFDQNQEIMKSTKSQKVSFNVHENIQKDQDNCDAI